ncbi:hypothetical protein [Cysteiniphilum halobium]|uniref:hypothetical protein n=1 Tax=Cysteiniphilum halobium TaxID=2219059 RepID=UPI000E655400|nr:hypothetical protein [Cysteiniphilum halobium]
MNKFNFLPLIILLGLGTAAHADFEYYSNIDNTAYTEQATDNNNKYPIIIFSNPNDAPLDAKIKNLKSDGTDVHFFPTAGHSFDGDADGRASNHDIAGDLCSLSCHDLLVHLPAHGACYIPYSAEDGDAKINMTILNDMNDPTVGMTLGYQQQKSFYFDSYHGGYRSGGNAAIYDRYSGSNPEAGSSGSEDSKRYGYISYTTSDSDDDSVFDDIFHQDHDDWSESHHHDNNNMYGRAVFMVYTNGTNEDSSMNDLIRKGKNNGITPFVSGNQDIMPCTFTKGNGTEGINKNDSGSDDWMNMFQKAQLGGMASCVSKDVY